MNIILNRREPVVHRINEGTVQNCVATLSTYLDTIGDGTKSIFGIADALNLKRIDNKDEFEEYNEQVIEILLHYATIFSAIEGDSG